MTMPLSGLIRGREFDGYQEGLRARSASGQVTYDLTYCQPSDDSAMWLDLERDGRLGRLTVWESGLCDVSLFDEEGRETYLHYRLKCEIDFHRLLESFFLHFLDGRPLPESEIK
jgi:hypothetical protein